MAQEFIIFNLEIFILACGKTINFMAKEFFVLKMVRGKKKNKKKLINLF
jgi:hypothetical protein